MISSNKFFSLGRDRMTDYLYNRFPAIIDIVPINDIKYVEQIKHILGISGYFYTVHDLKFKNNRVAKKRYIFVGPQSIATLGKCITIKSYCYKIQITISEIYHCEPDINITIEENKIGKD